MAAQARSRIGDRRWKPAPTRNRQDALGPNRRYAGSPEPLDIFTQEGAEISINRNVNLGLTIETIHHEIYDKRIEI